MPPLQRPGALLADEPVSPEELPLLATGRKLQRQKWAAATKADIRQPRFAVGFHLQQHVRSRQKPGSADRTRAANLVI